jgi:hypothetical protein
VGAACAAIHGAIQLDGFAVDDVLQLSRGLNATAADDGLAEKR